MKLALLNSQLAAYRGKHKLSLQKMADLLKVTSGSTINNWEHGDPIPGPASILLEWLINGKVPFQDMTVPPSVREEVWKVTMNLEAFERMDALRLAGGYASVTDFIAGLIQEELAKPEETHAEFRTADQAPVDEMALLAEVKPGDAGAGAAGGGANAGGDVNAHLDAAAEKFAQENPLPPAPAADAAAPAGRTAARRDVTYKPLPRKSGIAVRKR